MTLGHSLLSGEGAGGGRQKRLGPKLVSPLYVSFSNGYMGVKVLSPSIFSLLIPPIHLLSFRLSHFCSLQSELYGLMSDSGGGGICKLL
jgi:hypothetical protein